MTANQAGKGYGSDMDFFKREAARLRREFDAKTNRILERVRERKLREIKGKIQG